MKLNTICIKFHQLLKSKKPEFWNFEVLGFKPKKLGFSKPFSSPTLSMGAYALQVCLLTSVYCYSVCHSAADVNQWLFECEHTVTVTI